MTRARTLVHGAWRHALARATGRPIWTSVTALVTLRCNQGCAYCDFPRHAGPEWDTATWLAALGALRRHGTLRLGLSGGEPLLRPDLGSLIREAARLGFVSSLTTNGTLLAERVDDVAPVDFLLCTIEADAARHDAARGAGAWDATVAGLAAVQRRGGVRLGLICPVHTGNLDALESPLRLAEDLGVRVFYQPIQERQGWAGARFGGIAADPDVRDAFRRVAAWKRAGRAVGNSRPYLYRLVSGTWPALARACTAGRYFVTLLPDGRIVPCCMVPFSADAPRFDPAHPEAAWQQPLTPACAGCTIAPYLENHMIFTLDLASIWNSLWW